MISDLVDKGSLTEEGDFLVIGAGTVGLPFCTELATATGKRVICLESGGRSQDHETHPLNEVVHLALPYEGAQKGRFRCIGGTSTRWGGALIPFQAADLFNAGWPIKIDELLPYLPKVEHIFGLSEGGYTDEKFPIDLRPHYVNRLAKWPAFKHRNVVNVVGSRAEALQNLQVWLNATVTQIRCTGEGVEVVASTAGGDQIKVCAARLVIAAGAIETTRLALLLRQQNPELSSAISPVLGCGFADHISIGVAEIRPVDAAALNKVVGFRFEPGGSMRNIRFELAMDTPLRQTLPPSFVHIGFQVDKPGGFDALRDVFRYLQQRRLPPPKVLVHLLKGLPWLLRAVWWRFVHRRLLYPEGARLVAHVVIEQTAASDHTITLSNSHVDPFGLPRAEINWSITAADVEKLHRVTDAFEQTWNDAGFSRYGTWKRYPKDQIGKKLAHSGGIYHPTGSTQMGYDARSGVVDADLRMFGAPQVQLLSTSVLPTGGGANPTMMLLLLAMRCVDQHVNANFPIHPASPAKVSSQVGSV
ncbi:GMC oxidoreductase [Rhizobium straminoryzae]|uniref:GMC family oxidoreductase n=1 Tax=Rhizobium straminoryzae TaxID=1387186 RepID=A0A549TC25_9HYPH|nr:GMC oxidoreductase [Rhizobium straminoryzae]TRL39421.1 GMC family oxidoreductase [Rhizobium straminoryzae]